MKHINTLMAGAALAAPFGAIANSQAQAENPVRQNIVFIFAEDMGLDINPYRPMPFPTPGLDRLAAMGTVFEHAYATAPTCSPSRASVFTGLQIFRHGQIGLSGRGYHMNDDIPMFPDALKRAGYYTAITYKFHFYPEPEFDTGPYDHTQDGLYHKERVGTNPREVYEVGRAALERAEAEGRPWFLYLNAFDTHTTGQRPYRAEHERMWVADIDGYPRTPMTPDDVDVPPYMAGDPSKLESIHPNVLHNMAAYANALQRVDHLVEWTLDMLEEKGLLDDTLIIFSADHGPSWPRGKQMIYNVGVQVPLIVAGPGLPRGKRSTALISLADIAPTIIEASGEPVPADLPSQSITAVLRGDAEPRPYVGASYFNHWGPGGLLPSYTIRDQRYKLIYNVLPDRSRPITRFAEIPFLMALPDRITDRVFEEAFLRTVNSPEFELYDLLEDPWEFHDLSHDPSYADTLLRLQHALTEWRKEQEDPFLDPGAMERLFQLHGQARRAIDGQPSEEHGRLLREVFTELQPLFR